MSKDRISEEAAATGGTGFTEAQLASIGGVVQGLLDKALRKDRPANYTPARALLARPYIPLSGCG